MSTQPGHFITVEEYLKLEETSEERHEYCNGEIFAMPSGSPVHAEIASNLIQALGPTVRALGRRVRGSDMGVKTPSGLYTYPDVTIVCQPEQFDGNFLLNPVVIVEVLSDSTDGYDRGKKFEKYRQIESFREYLLVAQDRFYVEHHQRGASAAVWTMREFKSADGGILLNTLNTALPVSLIYADITLGTLPIAERLSNVASTQCRPPSSPALDI